MHSLKLTVLSLRYSSWSMRAWLALTHSGARFTTETASLTSFDAPLSERRALGSVAGLFPVLWVDDVAIHESLAIVEFVAEAFPDARLWPETTLARARARAVCAEMASNFLSIRGAMSCHLFGRAPAFSPNDQILREIARVFEIWTDCLDRSRGPFLFGAISLADFFYFPMLTRFRTYGIDIPAGLGSYAAELEAHATVASLIDAARAAPRMALYDDYIESLGGDPDGAKPGRALRCSSRTGKRTRSSQTDTGRDR